MCFEMGLLKSDLICILLWLKFILQKKPQLQFSSLTNAVQTKEEKKKVRNVNLATN